MTELQKLKKPSLDDRIQAYLLLFLRVSVVVAAGLALYFREWGAFLYSLLTFVLMFLPTLIKSWANVRLPIEFDVTLVIFMYAAVFLGKVGGAYEHFWWWDGALHTSSGFILAFIGFLVLYVEVQRKKIQASRLLFGLIVFSMALSIGALWEIFEFIIDSLFDGNLQRGSLRDTMWDLIVDSAGALVMSIIGVRIIYDKKSGIVARLIKNFIKANPRLGEKYE